MIMLILGIVFSTLTLIERLTRHHRKFKTLHNTLTKRKEQLEELSQKSSYSIEDNAIFKLCLGDVFEALQELEGFDEIVFKTPKIKN